MCTTDIVSRHKCDWLAEIARASGIEPELQCKNEINSVDNMLPEISCFEAVKNGRAELTVAHPDWQTIAKRLFLYLIIVNFEKMIMCIF